MLRTPVQRALEFPFRGKPQVHNRQGLAMSFTQCSLIKNCIENVNIMLMYDGEREVRYGGGTKTPRQKKPCPGLLTRPFFYLGKEIDHNRNQYRVWSVPLYLMFT